MPLFPGVDSRPGSCDQHFMPLWIKICGVSSEDAVAAALAAGCDALGFVFFPKSPRNVTVERAAALARPARGRAAIVALTVDADDATLEPIVRTLAPDRLQLHGSESPERVAGLRRRFDGPVMKAIGLASADDLAVARPYFDVADLLLFDAKPPKGANRPGGNGAAFDWTLLQKLDLPLPFVLSGGLNAGNVAEAVRIARPLGVDASSSVERAPGDKDPEKITAFIRAARGAGAASESNSR